MLRALNCLARPVSFTAAIGTAWAWAATAVAAPTEPGTLQNPLEPAQECRYCHQHPNANDAAPDEPAYAPFFGWQGSMMGNAARDPVFWAAVALASQDEPEETQSCIRCHSPRAFLEGRGDAIAIEELTEPDLNGVDCEVCHRMVDDGVTGPGNAQYTIDDTLVGDAVPRRGPWDYTDGVPEPTAHPVVGDPFTGSSAMCGTCHDVTTGRERVDDDGNGMGIPFNEQRTYSEWAGSAYAQQGADFASCQDCHMPAVGPKAGCNDYINVHSHETGGVRHDLVGANRFMIQLIGQEYGELFGQFYWDLALERIDAFLQTAATVDVQGPDSVDLREGLSGLQVTVTNETGHKLPTGYSEGRVMWIEVVASYDGQEVWSSGRWDEANADFERDDQVHTYEAVAQDYADGTRFHLLRNNHWVIDSRLPPKGLQPDVQTDPIGDRYTLQGDGTWPHVDTASYTFAARDDVLDATPQDGTDDQLEIRVRLLYLINTRAYIDLLVDDNVTNEAGTHVAGLFEAAGWATPVVVGTEQVLTVPLTGFATGSGTTGSDTTGQDETSTTVAGQTSTTTMGGSMDTTGTSMSSSDTAEEEESDAGGCGCRSDRREVSPWLSWLLLLGLASRSRAHGAGGSNRARSRRAGSTPSR